MRIDGWNLYETYRRVPAWLRATLGVLLIAAGFTLARSSHQHLLAARAEERRTGKQNDPLRERSDATGFQFGLYLTAAVGVVLATSGRTRSERNGYRF